MSWKSLINGYCTHLRLERSLSANTISAYKADVSRLSVFAEEKELSAEKVDSELLRDFVFNLGEQGIAARSQARIVSGVKGFFNFLLMENLITTDPAELLELPRLGRKLPVVLNVPEVESMMANIDLSSWNGQRNRAIMETLYSCGLRVSESIDLLISNLHFQDGFIKVVGKGDKERLVPIGRSAMKHINLYRNEVRIHQRIISGQEDVLFLNKMGRKLSRVSVFNLVKDLASKASINKVVSPHTLRHSFATHLIEGGADLRSVQEMLGHESITTTEIYTHLDRDYLRSSIISHHPLET